MNYCPNCGKEMQGRFCHSCGFDSDKPQTDKKGFKSSQSGDSEKQQKENKFLQVWLKFCEFIKKNKMASIIVSSSVAVVLILSTVLGVIFGNKFSTLRVSKIELGDSQAQVEKILGKPTEAEEGATEWFWYPKSFADKVAKIEKLLLSGTGSALEKIEKLSTELAKKPIKVISVEFDNAGTVSSVTLDTKYKYDPFGMAEEEEKEVKKVGIPSNAIKLYEQDVKVEDENGSSSTHKELVVSKLQSYFVKFKDGSYYKTSVGRGVEILGTEDKRKVKLEWKDEFGEHSFVGYKQVLASLDENGFLTKWRGSTVTDYWSIWNSYRDNTHVVLPSDITWIMTLDNMSIKSVKLHAGVTFIDGAAFGECPNLKKIEVSKDNKIFSSKGNCVIRTASKTLVAGCSSSVIPADGSVTTIGTGAFTECNKLKSIVIPKEVVNIMPKAFDNCKALTTITISAEMQTIAPGAFYDCSELTLIEFGGTVAQWEAICEGSSESSAGITVKCSDGTTKYTYKRWWNYEEI